MSFFPRDLPAPAPPSGPSVEWEETGCLLCGRRHWVHLIEAPDRSPGGSGLWFAVVQCQECGLCFTNPRPSKKTIGQFYPPQYSPHRLPTGKRVHRRGFRSLAQRQLPGKENWEVLGQAPGRLLDFGCGAGAFLARMHDHGWKVTGIDVNVRPIQRIQSEMKLQALVGTLPHPDLAPASFDVITMRHSLEHVHDPLEVLRHAHRLLVPGGTLLVSVPNLDSFPYRLFGKAWVGLDLPRHLTHFTPLTLRRMLERAGFTVNFTQMVRHSNWLRTSAKQSCQAGRVPFWHRWLRKKSASNLATWYSYLTNQTDCLLVTAVRGADIH